MRWNQRFKQGPSNPTRSIDARFPIHFPLAIPVTKEAFSVRLSLPIRSFAFVFAAAIWWHRSRRHLPVGISSARPAALEAIPSWQYTLVASMPVRSAARSEKYMLYARQFSQCFAREGLIEEDFLPSAGYPWSYLASPYGRLEEKRGSAKLTEF